MYAKLPGPSCPVRSFVYIYLRGCASARHPPTGPSLAWVLFVWTIVLLPFNRVAELLSFMLALTVPLPNLCLSVGASVIFFSFLGGLGMGSSK